MTHYEERLQRDLATLREMVGDVSKAIEKALGDAIHAVLTLDRPLAYQTVLGDMPINRKVREIDRFCHAFVARHLPSAGHLRFVSAVMRLGVALERVGDYAVAICRETVQLSATPPETVARDIELLAEQNRRTLAQALKAFGDNNAEMARGTIGMAGQLDATFDRVFADLLRAGEKGKRPIRDLFALLVVFNRLSRVGDQAKNICEETLFAATGETKQPKVYRILFIDERNDCASQIAEAYARKAFPESGRYESAGWNPADRVDARCSEYMDGRGLDRPRSAPRQLTTVHEELTEFHVIVSLAGDPREHLAEVPFHTVLLQWELTPLAGAEGNADLETLTADLSSNMRGLMELLRGQEAS
jgi:phosphate transport system protein